MHIGDHGIDGHPGWDVEFRVGATIVAAADGIVQSVLPSEGGAAFGIQLTHLVGGRPAYRTIYGVGTLASGVSPNASIVAGQPLGIASSYTRTIGTVTVTYAFTHFQLDDFSSNVGLTNPNAISPEAFLNSDARGQFQSIWNGAVYNQELVEPFVTNTRDVTFPMSRTWTLQSGGLASTIEFTRSGPFANGFSYVMRNSAGLTVEAGLVELEVLAKPSPTLDFIASSGARRRGIYSIVDGSMRIDYGAPGGTRPASLANASTYSTIR